MKLFFTPVAFMYVVKKYLDVCDIHTVKRYTHNSKLKL